MKMRKIIFGLLQAIAVILVILIVAFYLYISLPIWGIPFNAQRHGRVPLTPPWALECWLWEDDKNTAAAVDELITGYAEHDLPVRTILLDSPWSLRYNDFIVDEARYPNPAEWFRKLQDQGYRVVLWMTCMVNSENDNTAIKKSLDWYEQARQNGYLVGDGYQFKWWQGRGGFIDYTNPQAMTWWRGLQQQVFDYGIDGWKLDGTATFFSSELWGIPFPYQRTHKGWMTTRGYMDLYYREEYRHGKSQNPDFITLARSIDRPYTHPEGFAPFDAAPVTWVGDQKHAWKSGGVDSSGQSHDEDLMMRGEEGIEEALRDILLAAKRGYCIIGSDVGGYSGRIIPPRLYIRWAQLSCFCGLFLNGGHGERALWKRSQQELEVIRKFSWLHTELIPYMYSHVVACHNGGKPLQRPIKGKYKMRRSAICGQQSGAGPLLRPMQSKYHYFFGDDFLVAPIYQDSPINTVHLPRGRWRYFFNDNEVIDGPTTFTRSFPLDEYPVYVRDGAIVPMNVNRSYTGLGDENSAGYLTWLIYPQGANRFTVHHPDGSGSTTVRVSEESGQVKIQFDGTKKRHILRVLLPTEPERIELDGIILAKGQQWRYDSANQRLWIRMEGYEKGRYKILTQP